MSEQHAPALGLWTIDIGFIWTVRQLTANTEHDLDLLTGSLKIDHLAAAPVLAMSTSLDGASKHGRRLMLNSRGAMAPSFENIVGPVYAMGRPWFRGVWNRIFVLPLIHEPETEILCGRAPWNVWVA